MNKSYRWLWTLIIIGTLFIGIFIMINKSEKDCEDATAYCIEGYDHLRNQDIESAIESYTRAYERVKADSIAARIIACEQNRGNKDSALRWLDIFEENSEKSDFTALRRVYIHLQFNETENACKLLDSIIATPIEMRTSWFGRSLLDSWLNSDSDYTKAENYYRYYTEYGAKLLALDIRMSLADNINDKFKIGSALFALTKEYDDIYEIMDGYFDLQHSNPRVFNKIFNGTYRLTNELDQHVAYMIGQVRYNTDNIIEIISDYKWQIFNLLITHKHLHDGYDAAIRYANDITRNNTRNVDAYNNFQKYIYGIYLGASDNQKFHSLLTREELDDIISSSTDANNVIPPAIMTVARLNQRHILDNSKYGEQIEGDKPFFPIIILECNDWRWDNSTKPLAQYIYEAKGQRKTIRYIDDNFNAHSSYTDLDYFGITINYKTSNLACLKMLHAEFNKQMTK